MECVAIKVPLLKELDLFTFLLCPHVTVGKWCEQGEDNNSEDEIEANKGTADLWPVAKAKGGNSVGAKVVNLAESHYGEVKGREVVMQEELTSHQEKGKVVKSPAENSRADLVVESLEVYVRVVTTASLPAQY